ncbi:class I SAM-dependent methyltransferase [Hydrogenophaga palleronii]|uniref:class I SAM-dependent methyltransferase n=1 Tax=Hydrogenophaga palleronii TaxID=65655 RepID=UPI000A911A9A|nr:rRNA adenine N-6-methyltransferase family protein [Hydrogenophaga palleronii]
MRHGLAFALGCLRNPRHIGAIAPASRALARAIASEVSRTETGGVLIEVGAGTGAITRELAASSAALDRFVVIERDPDFARMLRRAFPLAEVLNHCASLVDSIPIDVRQPVTLVSSLPLLSMPREEARRCEHAMLALIGRQPGSRLIQYTYAAPHLRPFHGIPPGWHWRRSASVWANLPPATVWALERVPSLTFLGVH